MDRAEPVEDHSLRVWERRGRLNIGLGFLLAALPLTLLIPIGHDQIWAIWIGRRLLHGAQLYRDIVEVNPPLWFWMAVPQAALGELLGIQSRYLVAGFFIASIALALVLSPARYRLPIALALTLLPLADYGQREHFSLIATVPYAFLIAARANGEPARHSLAIGLFAAFGFALKPYFALVPLCLELMILGQPRRRPETIVLVAAAIAYGAAIILFEPEYMTTTVPLLLKTYDWIRGPSILPFVLLLFVVGFAALVIAKPARTSRVLAVTALAFLLAMILQGKGWSYHSVPARGFLFLALASELGRKKKPVTAALLATSAVLCFLPTGIYRNPFRDEVAKHLEQVPPKTSIFVLSENPAVAWPMIEERGMNWGSRQFCAWQAIAAAHGVPGAAQSLQNSVVLDLKSRPDLLILPRPTNGDATLRYIPQDVLKEYRRAITTNRFVSYQLVVRA